MTPSPSSTELGLSLCRSGPRERSYSVLSVKLNTNVYLGCTFPCARQFRLAVSKTTYVKFRTEFISVTHLWKPGSFQMPLPLPSLLPGTTLGNDNILKPALFLTPPTHWLLHIFNKSCQLPKEQADMVPFFHVPGVRVCLLSGCTILRNCPWNTDPAGHYFCKAVGALLQPQWVLMLSLTSLVCIQLIGAEFCTPMIRLFLPTQGRVFSWAR